MVPGRAAGPRTVPVEAAAAGIMGARMTPRRFDDLLRTAAETPAVAAPRDRAAAVWRHIRRGWDPERIEWQHWLRRWWPWVAVVVLAAALGIALLPHGEHGATGPPPLGLFNETNVSAPAAAP